MVISDTSIPAEVRRLNGLLAWWGLANHPGANGMEAHARQLQLLVSAANELLSEASSNHAQALSAAYEQLTRALQEFVSARQPSELIAARAHLVTSLKECFAAQARSWAELTRKLDACCSGAPHEAAAEPATGADNLMPMRPKDAGRSAFATNGKPATWSQSEALSWMP
ncbi:MAG: hypothetical protein KJZ80_04545 [Hyphomicrobiaceae bacterium]|nr:hypothetical protein [Hyphomicrobiaceae bacterium]